MDNDLIKLEERLVHSHRLMQYIIEHDRSSIAVLDKELRYIYVSKRFLKDYNVKEVDILGKGHYEVFPDLPESWKEAHKKSLAGEVLSAEEDKYIKDDGSVVWVRWESRPWYESDGSVGGIILYTEVITAQKEAETELIRAKEKAEENDRLKTAFLQNMSHEVRTPLNSIVGFSQLISEPNQSLQKIRAFSRIISINSDKLIGIISDVIEISKIQSKQVMIVLSRLDIISLIKKNVDLFREIAQLKSIDFLLKQNIPSDLQMIVSDKGKLDKIFYHLIDNAIKFTHEGSIEISSDIVQGNLHFKVADTGIGIDEDKQKIIFEPFRQIETGLSRDYGGTGLGLTIVKSYTELLNGTISFNSEKNKGTQITISIPVTEDPGKKYDVNKKRYTGRNNNFNTVLIAEDEYSNFKYLYELLHSDTMEVLHANNGREAIDICRGSDDISMILMDIKMPIMDGTSAARLIKEFRPGLPIIAQTAYIPESEKLTSLNVFDDLIEKPINRNELKQKMEKYITV